MNRHIQITYLYLFIYRSVIWICLFICLFIYFSVNLSIYLSLYVYLILSVLLFISIIHPSTYMTCPCFSLAVFPSHISFTCSSVAGQAGLPIKSLCILVFIGAYWCVGEASYCDGLGIGVDLDIVIITVTIFITTIITTSTVTITATFPFSSGTETSRFVKDKSSVQ